MLQKLPIAKTMCGVQIIWGIILICTGVAKNFPTLVALRVLLGALEAPIVPGKLSHPFHVVHSTAAAS